MYSTLSPCFLQRKKEHCLTLLNRSGHLFNKFFYIYLTGSNRYAGQKSQNIESVL